MPPLCPSPGRRPGARGSLSQPHFSKWPFCSCPISLVVSDVIKGRWGRERERGLNPWGSGGKGDVLSHPTPGLPFPGLPSCLRDPGALHTVPFLGRGVPVRPLSLSGHLFFTLSGLLVSEGEGGPQVAFCNLGESLGPWPSVHKPPKSRSCDRYRNLF